MPRITIIAGPNGAGKTTFAREYLPQEASWPTFLNADVFAADLCPEAPERAAFAAGRLMVQRLRECARRGEDFAFETTLAGRTYARLIPSWQQRGYRIELCYLRLPHADFAVARVRQRVAQGGHSVLEADIRRRFERSRGNFDGAYRPLADLWVEYDASKSPGLRLRAGGAGMPETKDDDRSLREEFPFLAGMDAAMKRAGERALRLAAETPGAIVGWKNGRVEPVPVPEDDPRSAATNPEAFGRPPRDDASPAPEE